MNDRTKAVVIGGLLAGVLSGLPVISGCCFLWALAGGFLTVFMYMKNAPAPLAMGDAAKLGAMAGVIGAVISLVLGVPLMLLGVGAAAMQNPDLGRAGISSGLLAVGGVVGLCLRAVIVAGFAALGGIIAAAVLGKNRPGGAGPMPPPPAGFGGPPPSGFGGPQQPQPPAGGFGAGT